MRDGQSMKPSEFEAMPLHIGQWRGWLWHYHYFMWVFPAVLLIVSASEGSSGLAVQLARILCWVSAVALQVAVCPKRPWVLTADSDYRKMTIWPLGIWHDARLSNLWRIHRQGAASVLGPPLANFFVALFCALFLGICNVQSSWNPIRLEGPWFLDGSHVQPFSLFWWMGQLGHAHWTLVVAACLPALPMTGGQLISLMLDHTHWNEVEARDVRRNFALATFLILVGLGTWQAITGHDGGFIVLMLGLIIGIEIRRQARRDAAMAFIEAFLTSDLAEDQQDSYAEEHEREDLDFENWLSKPRRPPLQKRVSQWIKDRRTLRILVKQERLRENQLADLKRLDELLVQIHERGMTSLKWQERRFLRKMSERIKNCEKNSG